jgi:hypothetical protein
VASLINALVCARIATPFWPLLGYTLGSRPVPRILAISAAAVIGWSVHSASTLPIYLLFEFRRPQTTVQLDVGESRPNKDPEAADRQAWLGYIGVG